MPDVDYYAVLDVSHTATAEQIRSAYYRAVRRAHPDAGGSAEEFRLVIDAYRTLSDKEKRASYDARFVGRRTSRRGTETPNDHRAYDAPPEPEWGSEVDWDVDPRDVWVKEQAAKAAAERRPSDSWVHRRNGLLLVRWGRAFVVAAGFFLGYVLFFQASWIRPEKSGADLWGWVLETTPALVVVVTVYALAFAIDWAGFFLPALIAHVTTLFGIFWWLFAYWDISTFSERITFLGIALLFVLYATMTTVVSMMDLARYYENVRSGR